MQKFVVFFVMIPCLVRAIQEQCKDSKLYCTKGKRCCLVDGLDSCCEIQKAGDGGSKEPLLDESKHVNFLNDYHYILTVFLPMNVTSKHAAEHAAPAQVAVLSSTPCVVRTALAARTTKCAALQKVAVTQDTPVVATVAAQFSTPAAPAAICAVAPDSVAVERAAVRTKTAAVHKEDCAVRTGISAAAPGAVLY